METSPNPAGRNEVAPIRVSPISYHRRIVVLIKAEIVFGMGEFSRRHKFADWPNREVSAVCAGVYAVWDNQLLIYAGMSGRGLEEAMLATRSKYGLITRLASHAAGRLSGDQFCVYVANRLVIPSLRPDQLALFASGELTLDKLTKAYINTRFEYQFAQVISSAAAYALERDCRKGLTFGIKPTLNPL